MPRSCPGGQASTSVWAAEVQALAQFSRPARAASRAGLQLAQAPARCCSRRSGCTARPSRRSRSVMAVTASRIRHVAAMTPRDDLHHGAHRSRIGNRRRRRTRPGRNEQIASAAGAPHRRDSDAQVRPLRSDLYAIRAWAENLCRVVVAPSWRPASGAAAGRRAVFCVLGEHVGCHLSGCSAPRVERSSTPPRSGRCVAGRL